MKRTLGLIIGVMFTTFGFSQTTQQKVEKQIQDPQRKINAGKADAVSANKRNIFDSTTFDNTAADAGTRKTVKAGSKKKYCGNKTKTSKKRA